MPPSNRETLFWHPCVHRFVNQDLHFFSCRINGFQPEAFRTKFQAFMTRQGYGGYRAYTVYGDASVLLRVWLAHGGMNEFHEKFRQEFPETGFILPFTVTDVPEHWIWRDWQRQLAGQALRGLNPDRIGRIQSNEPVDREWAEHEKLVRFENVEAMREGRNFIRLYTFVGSPTPPLYARTNELVQRVLQTVRNANVQRVSVYLGVGSASFLIRGEVLNGNYYDIYELVNALSKLLPPDHRVTTATHLCASTDFLIHDLIGERTLRELAHAHVDPAVKALLPQLYDPDASATPAPNRPDVQEFTKGHVLAMDLSAGLPVSLREALLNAARANEAAFISSMQTELTQAEMFLRRNFKNFMRGVVPSSEIEPFLKEIGFESRRNYAIGDYLAFYARLIERARVADPAVFANCPSLANHERWGQLRNSLAHGVGYPDSKEEYRFDTHWKAQLECFVDFLKRFPPLRRGVEESLQRVP